MLFFGLEVLAFVFTAAAAVSGLKTYEFVKTKNPISAGLAVFTGLVAMFCCAATTAALHSVIK